MQQYPIYSDTHCSNGFVKAHIEGGKTDYCFCEACQRTICTSHKENYYADEYEACRERAQKSHGYVFLGPQRGSISYGYLNGWQIVFDCPCNYARLVENDLLKGIAHSAPPIEVPWPQ